jgi:Uri superfamily endonuclease
MKGSYILLVRLPQGQTIKTGSMPDVYFSKGYYAYVGSAMGGLKSRLNHHLKKNKRPRWHIDYLLQKASISGIILCQTSKRVECLIAQALSAQFDSILGFGSSDCKCRSHLFFSPNENRMKSTILAILNSLPIDKRIHLVDFLQR